MANGQIQNRAAFDGSPSVRAWSTDREKLIWDFMKPAFDWGIAPTDIDGLVERNGNYLLFECKRKGAEIPIGQQRLLRDLNERHGFTVFVVTGFTESTICELDVFWPRRVRHEPYRNIRARVLLDKARQWFDWADGKPPVRFVQKTPQEQTIEEWLRDYDAA